METFAKFEKKCMIVVECLEKKNWTRYDRKKEKKKTDTTVRVGETVIYLFFYFILENGRWQARPSKLFSMSWLPYGSI